MHYEFLKMFLTIFFRHKSPLTLPKLMSLDPSLHADLGVCHGDELFTMFHQAMLEPMKTKAEREMGQKMLKLW